MIVPSNKETFTDKRTKKQCKETRLAESIEIIYNIITFLLIKWPQNSSSKATRCNQIAFKLFSYFVHIVLALNSGRFSLLFINEDVRKQNIILALMVFFYTTFITCSIIYRLFCMDHFIRIRDRLLKLELHLEDEEKLIHMTQQLKIILKFQLPISTLFSIVFCSLLLFVPDENSALLIFHSYPITVKSDAYLTVSMLVIILLGVGILWTHVIAYFNRWLMIFLRYEFDCLAESFRRDFPSIDNSQENNLTVAERSSRIFEVFKAHDELCGVLDSVNILCCHYLWFTLIGSIAQICLLAYEIIHPSMGTFEFVYMICILIFTAIGAFSYIGEGIQLKSSAHQLTDDLYAIDLRNLSSEASLKVSIFLTRLTGSPIGISVAGLFVIDHSTILMLAGTLLTYIIVVIQTKTPDCQCLNNNNITTSGV